MIKVCFFVLLLLPDKLAAQNTFLLSAGNSLNVSLSNDTTLMLYYKDGIQVINAKEIHQDSLGMYAFEPAKKILIKNISKIPGKYIIYLDQSINNCYIPLIFEVDKMKNISIIYSNDFFGYIIKYPCEIIFTSTEYSKLNN